MLQATEPLWDADHSYLARGNGNATRQKCSPSLLPPHRMLQVKGAAGRLVDTMRHPNAEPSFKPPPTPLASAHAPLFHPLHMAQSQAKAAPHGVFYLRMAACRSRVPLSMRTHVRAHEHTRTHTHVHTHTRAHTRVRAHTHTHTTPFHPLPHRSSRRSARRGSRCRRA